MSLRIGRGDDAKRALLSNYAVTPVGHNAAPADGMFVCCSGSAILRGHSFYTFRALPKAPGLEADVCYASEHCAQRLYALAAAPMAPVVFCDPLGWLEIHKHKWLLSANDGADDAVRMSPLNREASEVVTLLMQWVTPRVGSLVEKLAVRLTAQPANDLDSWDLRALNSAVNRHAASVGGSIQGVVDGLARRYRQERAPARMHFPLIQRALANANARSYI